MKRFGFMVAMSMLSGVLAAAPAIGKEITFIHTSDMHGDFKSHANPRDNQAVEGGLARVYTVIEKIREEEKNTFYVHTGDTLMGSAEVMFTKGQAMVDVLNHFGIQAFASGNWEWVYGVEHYRDMFLGTSTTPPKAPWNLVAANAYYNGWNPDYNAAADRQPGTLVIPPYRVFDSKGVKVGVFGCTTNRGPQIVGPDVVRGVSFTDCKGKIKTGTPTQPLNKPIKFADGTTTTTVEAEIPKYVNILRNVEKVDVVVMLSEAGLAENIYNAEHFDGIDVIFSSDMHEETNYPVVAKSPNGGTTIIVEEGEDGAQVGELGLEIKDGRVTEWKWTEHDITDAVKENKHIAKLVEKTLAPFRTPDFVPGRFVNPFNGTKLMHALDERVGYTEVELSRNNYSHMWDEANGIMPAVIEGTGHALMADAFRVIGKADIGAIRGFRYINNIPAGSELTYGDLYHYLSIGPQVARAKVAASVLSNSSENSADSCMNPDVTQWAGGWMFNYSGMTIDLNPYTSRVLLPPGSTDTTLIDKGRIFNMRVGRTSVFDPNPGVALSKPSDQFTYASYYYSTEPARVNAIPVVPGSIEVLVRDAADANGNGRTDDFTFVAPSAVTPDIAVDAVEIVATYIRENLGGVVTRGNLPFPRIHLTEALPDTRPTLGFGMIEPLFGMNKAAYYPALPANYLPHEYDQN